MKRSNKLWGLLFVLLALSILASEFNLFSQGPSFFHIASTAILIFMSATNIGERNFFGIFMPLSFALWLNQNYFNLSVNLIKLIIASALLSIGLNFIFEEKKTRKKTFNFKANEAYLDGERIQVQTNFTTAKRYIRAKNLKHANLENNFGTLNVYFEESDFDQDGTQIYCDCNFGNLNIYFPKDVHIHNEIRTSLGSVQENYRPQSASGAQIFLYGDVSFGKIEIFYV